MRLSKEPPIGEACRKQLLLSSQPTPAEQKLDVQAGQPNNV
jgi:hypothetical protein